MRRLIVIASLALAAYAADSAPRFEVAAIHPSDPNSRGSAMRFLPGGAVSITGMTIRNLIWLAWQLPPERVSGGPKWLDSDLYDIQARSAAGSPFSMEAQRPRIQALLADRFLLKVHRETKSSPVYVLTIAKTGLKMQEAKGSDPAANGKGSITPWNLFVTDLSRRLGRPVIDKSGLSGAWFVNLEYSTDDGTPVGIGARIDPAQSSAGPSIFTAVQEQLGLKLDSAQAPVDTLVIDAVARPTPLRAAFRYMMMRMFTRNHVTLCILAAVSAAGLYAQKPVFTEDFESGKLDPAVWDQRTQGVATIAVQQDQAAHGKYALQVHYPEMAPASFAFIVNPHLPDGVKTHLFGRAYVKISAAIPPSHTVLTLAGAAGWPLSKFEEIGMQKATFQPSYQENKSARGQGRGEDVRHAEAPPFDKWFLLEWEFNDKPSTLTIWVDGQLSHMIQGDEKTDFASFQWPKGSGTVDDLVGGFSEAGFGARVWGAVPQAFDVFYDDIAIGTSRLGPVK